MAEIFAVAPKQIDTLWDRAGPLIERAMAYSNYDKTADVYEALREERAQLWIISTDGEIDAALVTQLKIDKRGKVCSVWALGGKDHKKWIHLINEIEAFAKREGCDRMVHELRPGWVRPMKEYGYRMTHATIEKVL